MIYDPLPIGKICRECLIWNPYPNLKKAKKRPDGVDEICLICHNIQSRARYNEKRVDILAKERARHTANPEKRREYDRQRNKLPERAAYRKVYGRNYRLENIDRLKARGRQYAKDHPEICARNAAKWAAKNPDKVKGYKRKHRKSHPEADARRSKLFHQRHPEVKQASEERRRARKRSLPHDFTVAQWRHCLAYWGNRCAICGRIPDDVFVLAADHWVPLGDPDCPGTVATNMLPLCHTRKAVGGGCNNLKWKHEPVKWLRGFIGDEASTAKLAEIAEYFASLT